MMDPTRADIKARTDAEGRPSIDGSLAVFLGRNGVKYFTSIMGLRRFSFRVSNAESYSIWVGAFSGWSIPGIPNISLKWGGVSLLLDEEEVLGWYLSLQ